MALADSLIDRARRTLANPNAPATKADIYALFLALRSVDAQRVAESQLVEVLDEPAV
jgi:hypothetical protein